MYIFILCFSLSHCPSEVTRDWFSSLYSFIGSLVGDYDLIHEKVKSKHLNMYLVIGSRSIKDTTLSGFTNGSP
jgi:hypothetical protein